jgi:hypothetical protein
MIMAMKPERAAEIHEQQELSQNKVGVGTRLDKFLAKIAGEDVGELTPKTNTERMLAKIYGDPAMSDIAPKTATEMALDAVAMQYDKMLIPDGSLSITENGTYNVADKETAEVNVPNPSTGSLSITTNGTYDVKNYASANVNVPSATTQDLFKGQITIRNNLVNTQITVGGLLEVAGVFGSSRIEVKTDNNIISTNREKTFYVPTIDNGDREHGLCAIISLVPQNIQVAATGANVTNIGGIWWSIRNYGNGTTATLTVTNS